jgi:hypothetical protein
MQTSSGAAASRDDGGVDAPGESLLHETTQLSPQLSIRDIFHQRKFA